VLDKFHKEIGKEKEGNYLKRVDQRVEQDLVQKTTKQRRVFRVDVRM
jgi:hypothetical protein